ncbi:MAG: hypothetical protein QXU20_02025 [Candidatus Woesearchaeota archaeon]
MARNLEESIQEFSNNIEKLINNISNITKDKVKCLEGYLFDVLKDFNEKRIGNINIYEKDENTLVLDYKKPTGDNLLININFESENKNKFRINVDLTRLRREKIIEYLSEINAYISDYILKINDIQGKNYGLVLEELDPHILNSKKLVDFLEEYAENPDLSRKIIEKMFFENAELQKLFKSEKAVYDKEKKIVELYFNSQVCYPKKAVVLELSDNFRIYYSGFEDKEINEKIYDVFENKNLNFAYKKKLLEELKNIGELKVLNLRLKTEFNYQYLKGMLVFSKEKFPNTNNGIKIILDSEERKIKEIIGINENNIDDAIKILQTYFKK